MPHHRHIILIIYSYENFRYIRPNPVDQSLKLNLFNNSLDNLYPQPVTLFIGLVVLALLVDLVVLAYFAYTQYTRTTRRRHRLRRPV